MSAELNSKAQTKIRIKGNLFGSGVCYSNKSSPDPTGRVKPGMTHPINRRNKGFLINTKRL
jgi:hypothetical protein